MIRVAHRINTIEALRRTPKHLGVEVDVRSEGGRLHLHHDPFVPGEDFVTWLAEYEHQLLILNVKEDGLEDRLRSTLSERGIDAFFFLDQPFPTMLKTARQGERRCAVRFSEYEALASVLAVRGLVDWVWVDGFQRHPLDATSAQALRAAGFRTCLVSPELQSEGLETDAIERLRARLEGVPFDAVCTKAPDRWA
ncbi:MAG: hypothetical protein R3B40_15220 [Polyangiales bacterium]|nr:hypothetical protein [Myxococcales bacterium]MCB9658311.1 hypothetical protein [Sandaracinaceae bacterium]